MNSDRSLRAVAAGGLDVVAHRARRSEAGGVLAGASLGGRRPWETSVSAWAASSLRRSWRAAVGWEVVDEQRRRRVEGDQRAADGGERDGVGVLEQRLHDLGGAVGGECEPPALVRPGNVETHSSRGRRARWRASARASGSLTTGGSEKPLEESRKRPARSGSSGRIHARASRIPAAARNRTQDLAQAVVVGKAEDRLAIVERSVKKAVHRLWTIGRRGDGRRRRASGMPQCADVRCGTRAAVSTPGCKTKGGYQLRIRPSFKPALLASWITELDGARGRGSFPTGGAVRQRVTNR